MANRTKDGWARWSYEQLLLRQPHIETAGLWQVGRTFIVHCPKLGEGLLADDGRPIEQWFRDNKAITTPIGLVAELPPGAEPLETRSLRELVATAASPKTLGELLLDLSLLLPHEFPRLWLTDSAGRIQAHVERPLDEAETGTLMTAYASLQLWPDLEILVSPRERSSTQGFRNLGGQGNLHLTPSRSLPESFPLKVKWLWEEDEQFWVDHRFQLFEEKQPDPRKVLPRGWTEPLSRCLVDAEAFPPRNIRNYLSLYEQVVLAMPQWHRYPQQLLALGLTEAELVELLRLGRVKLLLSKSVESYPPSLLEKVAEEAPESLLLSRRLAGATVADARRRMPLLYPPFSAHERHLVLRELVRATAAIQNPTVRNVMEGVIGEIKRFWTDSEYQLHYRGASTTLGIGIGPLAAVLYERLKGENFFLEFSSAGRIVEWGAALNASLFPVHTETFSAEGHSSILASIYSGVPNDPTLQRIGEAQTILDGILCIDNDAPVVEFASSFRGGDVDRLRDLVRKLKEDGPHPDLLADSIRDFNKQVKSFERNSEKLARLRITGPLGTLATSLLPLEASTKVYIGLGSWFIDQLFFGPITSSNSVVGKLLDGLRGGITGNPASAVLVSRWRKTLKNLG